MPTDDGQAQIVLTEDEMRDNPVLDQMLRDGLKKRDEVLGQDYFSRLKEWWNFRLGITASARTPTFRPNIMFSDLHWMTMQEAGDLTDNSPIPVITYYGKEDATRRPDHEKALRGQWYTGEYSQAFFMAALEAQLCGTGVLMQVHDYAGRGGRGNTLLKWIDTENFVVDPACTSYKNWGYVIYRSRLSLDEIRRRFNRSATNRLPRFPSPSFNGVPKIGQQAMDNADQMRMPPGPMQQMSFGPLGTGNETRIVEYIFMLDDGRKIVEQIDGKQTKLLPTPKTEPAYPNGRLIVRCDRMKLFDGPQPYKRFPFIPVQVHPARNNFWAPPPIRLVVQLQEIAQTLSRQNVENAVRLNNGLVLINEAMGVKADEVLGLPGERIRVNSTEGVERAVKILPPAQFPPEMLNLPDKMIEKMKLQYGFNQTRAGQPGQGNQSSNLFGQALTQASGLTQVRGRLMQPSVRLALEMVYETMLQYQNPTMFPIGEVKDGAMEFAEWAGGNPSEDDYWELVLDPNSIKAMSSTVARQYALLLRNAGLLPVKDTLEALQWPDAARIANDVKQDMAMQMLAHQDQRGRPNSRRAG